MTKQWTTPEKHRLKKYYNTVEKTVVAIISWAFITVNSIQVHYLRKEGGLFTLGETMPSIDCKNMPTQKLYAYSKENVITLELYSKFVSVRVTKSRVPRGRG